jgi:hypothetical protein
LIRGSSDQWRISVTTRTLATLRTLESPDDLPTTRITLDLTDFQWTVLRAYAEPIVLGRIEPANHKEVAAALNYSPNRVRQVLYEVWSILFAEGVPMLDVDDKRVAVVEAARVHGLLGA